MFYEKSSFEEAISIALGVFFYFYKTIINLKNVLHAIFKGVYLTIQYNCLNSERLWCVFVNHPKMFFTILIYYLQL